MKKIVSILAAAVIGSGMMSAKGVNFGVEAGYTYNNLAGDDYNTSSRSGFSVTGLVDVPLSRQWELQTGFGFIRKGGSETGQNMRGSMINFVKDIDMNYLRIPVMAGRRIDLGHGLSLTPQAGWYFAVGISGSAQAGGTDAVQGMPLQMMVSTFKHSHASKGDLTFMDYHPCRRFDTGLAIALNLKWQHLGLRVGYEYGVTPVTYYGRGHNSTLSVALSYWIKY